MLNMKESFLMSIVCSIFGLLAGLFISQNATGEGYEQFPLFTVFASLLCSFFLWHFIVIKKESTSISLGIFTGIMIVILSNYFTWYFMSLYYFTCNSIFGKCLSSLGEKTMNPIESIYLLLPYTVVSLVIAWPTIPLGAFLGAIMIKLQNNSRKIEKN